MAVITFTKYEADSGLIHRIGLFPDRAAAAGAAPQGSISSDIKVKISKSKGEYGIRPRGVSISRIVGTAPDQFRRTSFLPVLTEASFDSDVFAPGATIAIDGTNWTVSARVAEDF